MCEHDSEAWRVQAAKLARARTRLVGRAPKYPSDWQPYTVISQRSGLPLGDREAFELMAEQLEAGCKLEILKLHHPPGDVGYVLKFRHGSHQLYAKFQLKQVFIARSFHADDLATKDRS